ncbi:calcium-binding protein [Aliihoeflea sp. PC F10.4]
MMITVKGSQSQGASASNPAQAYVLKNGYEKSKTPYALFLMLMGLGLYLKSIFPGWSRPVEEDAPLREPELDAPQVAEIELASQPFAPQEEMTTGTVGADPGPGIFSGSKLIPLQPPAKFQFIQSPDVDFFLPEVDVDAFNLVEPYRQSVRATNDNMPGSSSGSPQPGNPSYPGTNNPGPGTDPGPDDGSEPNNPGNQTDPEDPVCAGPGTGGPCDKDDDVDPVRRPPRVNGPVQLYDITACAILAIGFLDLLRGASDPDGDVLSITGVTASSGILKGEAFGWTFQAAPYGYGPVTLTYTITDGFHSIVQTAHFNVLERGWFAGTDGDDTIIGTRCADDIEGGSGDDIIEGHGGDDVIHGGAGNDRIWGGDGNDTIFGGSGDDVIFAGRGNDIVWGGKGNDRIFGEDGDDILHGEDGDDFLSGGNGNDMLFGGAGNDALYGDAGNDHLDGGAGNDRLYGGAGNDRLFGGAGDDLLDGGAGDDFLSDGAGRDIVYGGAGNDTVLAAMDCADDIYDGGAGYDTLDYSLAQFHLAIDMEAGTAAGQEIGDDTISNFEKIIAGAGNDIITGSTGNDHIVAGAGDDHVEAGDGDDIIEDGAGSDVIIAGAGDDVVIAAMDGANDIYDGGEGCDTLDYSTATDDLLIDLEKGQASGIEIGCDTISGFETIIGGAGDDHFIVGSDEVALYGGAGENVFEFLAPHEQTEQVRIFEINDFKAGDRIRMDKYDLFEKVFDNLEDQFKQVYGKRVDEDDFSVRSRIEDVDGRMKTIIEADFNRDDFFETTIIVDGRHVLVMVETA